MKGKKDIANKVDYEVLEEKEVKGPNLKELHKELKEDIEVKNNKEKKSHFNKKMLIILSSVLVIIILILFIVFCLLVPTIKLKGDSEIKLTINSEYNEPGAEAKYIGKDVSNKIKINGSVDTSKLGDYTINYSIKEGLFKKSKDRLVKIVEDGPIITLEGDKEAYVCPDKEYQEIGFTAIKGSEDLTNEVVLTEENDIVTYTVKDKDNNMFVTTRKLIRKDIEKPNIVLNGNETMYVVLNNTFTDPGYTVEDNCDTGLNDKVTVEGSVDTSKLGTYEIKYSVSDEAGNNTEVTRKVIVQQNYVKRSANLGCGKAGVIYLTFDDGPNNTTTTQILDVLKKYNVKATFFVTNANGGSDQQIKREYDEGHLVALHTSTHEYYKLYASYEAYWSDLNAISSRVEKITGKKSMFIRFPGGSSNTVSRHYTNGIMSRLVDDVEAKGYSYFDWNVDSRDAEGKPSNEIYSNVVNNLSKSRGNVILMHDIKTTTANAIEDIIKYGLNNGYTFDVLDASVTCHHKTAN